MDLNQLPQNQSRLPEPFRCLTREQLHLAGLLAAGMRRGPAREGELLEIAHNLDLPRVHDSRLWPLFQRRALAKLLRRLANTGRRLRVREARDHYLKQRNEAQGDYDELLEDASKQTRELERVRCLLNLAHAERDTYRDLWDATHTDLAERRVQDLGVEL